MKLSYWTKIGISKLKNKKNILNNNYRFGFSNSDLNSDPNCLIMTSIIGRYIELKDKLRLCSKSNIFRHFF